MAKKRRKIVQYKRPLNINIGTVIFGITFLYICIYCFIYFTRDKISYYEVVQGKSAVVNSSSYTGLILRKETVTRAPATGYLHFYIRDCSKAAIGTTIYTLDEKGIVSDLLERAKADGTVLTSNNLKDIKAKIAGYEAGYDNVNFANVYDFKNELENTISECINLSALENLNTLADEEDKKSYQIYKAKQSGIIVCSTDGYEDLKENKLTPSDFNSTTRELTSHRSNELVESKTPIYKTINSEMWNLYFKISENDKNKYQDTDTLTIRFLKDDITLSANFELIEIEGEDYGKLTLSRYMLHYATERFLDFTIVEEEISGLKIPKSAIVEKDFYVVPIEYLTGGGDSLNQGFNIEKTDENGNIHVEFQSHAVYRVTEDSFYIDAKVYNSGAQIIMPDSNEKFTLSKTEKLQGVYNINNGYAVFKQIEILSESNDYAIIADNTDFGVTIYDHIVLKGDSVAEKQIIFQ